MNYRCIQSEYSSNGKCCHPITQSGLCHNCSYLLSGWHTIRSKRGQGRQTQEAIAFHRGQKNSGGEKEIVQPSFNNLSTYSRLIHPSIQSDPHIYPMRKRGKGTQQNSLMASEGEAQ